MKFSDDNFPNLWLSLYLVALTMCTTSVAIENVDLITASPEPKSNLSQVNVL